MAVVPNRTRVHENGFLSLSISYLCLRCCEKDVCAPPPELLHEHPIPDGVV